jgi:hypothetical protein
MKPRRVAELALGSIGVALVVCAIVFDQTFLDKHFLPSFLIPRDWYVLIETSARASIASIGMLLALVLRKPLARATARRPALAIGVAIAVVLALVASDAALSRVRVRPAGWLVAGDEPQRRPDPRLGWTLAPSRTGHKRVGGRVVDYTLDAHSYRVRRADEPIDPERSTILFAGESVMFGDGLTWDESIPAQVGTMVGVQSANLAVHGFSTDQAYLRLQAELPRFRRPVAVVTLFMTSLFGRNTDDERPHLGPSLEWTAAVAHPRLASLAGFLVPYRTSETVERGVVMTRDVLRAGVDLARARGATPLIVVPQFGAASEVDQMLRRRILDEPGLPYVWVELDAAWRLPWDIHPNAHAAHEIAAAIAARLRGD